MKESGARRYLLLEDVAPYISIDYLFPGKPRGLPVRARIALESNGIRTIGDLLQWTRDELLAGINIGRSIVQEVDERLRSKLGVGVGEWNP